jgi:hypothetical protein
MDSKEATRLLIDIFDQLNMLNSKYQCNDGANKIGIYVRSLLADKNIKTAINTLRRE